MPSPIPFSSSEDIRSLVAEDRLPKAISRWKPLDLNPQDQHTLTLLENRLHRWQRDQGRGTHSIDELNRKRSPIINAGGDVDHRQKTQPIQVPENLREYVTDTTLLDTTP